jgi:hypothetical protein
MLVSEQNILPWVFSVDNLKVWISSYLAMSSQKKHCLLNQTVNTNCMQKQNVFALTANQARKFLLFLTMYIYCVYIYFVEDRFCREYDNLSLFTFVF